MQYQRRLFRQKPDGAIDPAGEAGWFLQRERERRGETLATTAERCGIHAHHLEAIEAGDLTRLPRRIEALRMIGAYGAYLGFDPQPLVLHYAQFLPRPVKHPAASRPAAPKPLGSAMIISFPLAKCVRALSSGSGGVVASLLVVAGLFGAAIWTLPKIAGPGGLQQIQAVADADDLSEPVAETPVASITAVAETPLDDTVADDAAADETARADRAADGLPGLGDFISSQISAVDEAAIGPQGPVQPGAAGPGRIYGSDNAGARLVLKAKAPVWVRIEDRQGNVILTQTLLSGDSYRVPNRTDLVIIARDGGLLTVEIDGIDKGSLGTPGEILVGRPLDIATLASNG
ncbi:MAG TPA: RodZ domain-containing protein [Aestuariivirgaceae bacterium]|nr:RodZ domain-containing protein [Aestuariivirgaceae bacterium]